VRVGPMTELDRRAWLRWLVLAVHTEFCIPQQTHVGRIMKETMKLLVLALATSAAMPSHAQHPSTIHVEQSPPPSRRQLKTTSTLLPWWPRRAATPAPTAFPMPTAVASAAELLHELTSPQCRALCPHLPSLLWPILSDCAACRVDRMPCHRACEWLPVLAWCAHDPTVPTGPHEATSYLPLTRLPHV
jgi:hypothetical protein